MFAILDFESLKNYFVVIKNDFYIMLHMFFVFVTVHIIKNAIQHGGFMILHWTLGSSFLL